MKQGLIADDLDSFCCKATLSLASDSEMHRRMKVFVLRSNIKNNSVCITCGETGPQIGAPHFYYSKSGQF